MPCTMAGPSPARAPGLALVVACTVEILTFNLCTDTLKVMYTSTPLNSPNGGYGIRLSVSANHRLKKLFDSSMATKFVIAHIARSENLHNGLSKII